MRPLPRWCSLRGRSPAYPLFRKEKIRLHRRRRKYYARRRELFSLRKKRPAGIRLSAWQGEGSLYRLNPTLFPALKSPSNNGNPRGIPSPWQEREGRALAALPFGRAGSRRGRIVCPYLIRKDQAGRLCFSTVFPEKFGDNSPQESFKKPSLLIFIRYNKPCCDLQFPGGFPANPTITYDERNEVDLCSS